MWHAAANRCQTSGEKSFAVSFRRFGCLEPVLRQRALANERLAMVSMPMSFPTFHSKDCRWPVPPASTRDLRQFRRSSYSSSENGCDPCRRDRVVTELSAHRIRRTAGIIFSHNSREPRRLSLTPLRTAHRIASGVIPKGRFHHPRSVDRSEKPSQVLMRNKGRGDAVIKIVAGRVSYRAPGECVVKAHCSRKCYKAS